MMTVDGKYVTRLRVLSLDRIVHLINKSFYAIVSSTISLVELSS